MRASREGARGPLLLLPPPLSASFSGPCGTIYSSYLRDGVRGGKVTELKVEAAYYLLASLTEFLWERKLKPRTSLF